MDITAMDGRMGSKPNELGPRMEKQKQQQKKNSSETELSDDVDQWLIAFGTTRQNELCQKSGCEFIKKKLTTCGPCFESWMPTIFLNNPYHKLI